MKKHRLTGHVAMLIAPTVMVCSLFGCTSSQTASVRMDTAPNLFGAVLPSGMHSGRARDRQVVRSRDVVVNLPLLTGQAEPKAITLNLFEDVSLVAEPDQVVRKPNGVTWTGKLRGVPQSQVVIVVTGEVVSGNIDLPGARYQIRFAGQGVHEVQKIDQALFPAD
ncbi:MAG TPA: hypothetical protein VIE65_13655 [Methylobacter sp.]